MNSSPEEMLMMEKVTVNIEYIADAMEVTMDGWEQYLNRN